MKMRKLDQVLNQCLEELELKESTLDLDKLDKLMEDAYEAPYLSDEDIEGQYKNFEIEELKINQGNDDLTFTADMWINFPNADHPDYDEGKAEHVLVYWENKEDIDNCIWPEFSFNNWYPEKILEEIKETILEKIFEFKPEYGELWNN